MLLRAAATVSLENLQVLPFTIHLNKHKHMHMHGCTRAGLARLLGAPEREKEPLQLFFFPLHPRQLWFLVFIVSTPRLCCWSGFALIVQCPNWPRSRSLISMLPTHLGRFVAFFQDVSSLLRVMSTRYYCFNYVITVTGRNHFHPIISSLQFSPWEQTGEQSPRSAGLAPLVGKHSDCIPGSTTHCFNELPDCDSAAHFHKKKRKKPC